ncbi:MAG: shikimate kinase, partial [Clostridia bacterium]|nr:shikimate kinase [Clostridia bacterium]
MSRKLRCGLIGKPLGHSYSPEIHALLGDYEYTLTELEEEEVGEYLKSDLYDATNVTIPYKKTVMPFLDEISDEALRIG